MNLIINWFIYYLKFNFYMVGHISFIFLLARTVIALNRFKYDFNISIFISSPLDLSYK